MIRDLSHRALEAEQMDAEDLDPAVYAEVLRGLARVNAVTIANRPTRAFLNRALKRPVPFRLLDVGFGDGGMLRSIWRWAEKRAIACELVGIDLNPRSLAVAQAAHPPGADIRYRAGDYRDLAREPWDFIVSSLVTHHMRDDERHAFLRFMEDHAGRGWFVNDIHRQAIAYYGYPLLARMLRVNRIVREDGQLSIARGFRTPEWRAILADAGLADIARVQRVFPFRLCVERIRS